MKDHRFYRHQSLVSPAGCHVQHHVVTNQREPLEEQFKKLTLVCRDLERKLITQENDPVRYAQTFKRFETAAAKAQAISLLISKGYHVYTPRARSVPRVHNGWTGEGSLGKPKNSPVRELKTACDYHRRVILEEATESLKKI